MLWVRGYLISNKCRHADIPLHKTSFSSIRKRMLFACVTSQVQASSTLRYMQLAPCQDLVHFIINPLTALTVALAKMERLYSRRQKTSHRTYPTAKLTCWMPTHYKFQQLAVPFSSLPLYWVEEGAEKYNLPWDCD